MRPPRAYRLPEAMRPELAAPLGPVLQESGLAEALSGADVVAAVGDVVSMTLRRMGIPVRLFACDYRTQRGGASAEYRRVLGAWGDREVRVRNPPGQVTREAWDAVAEALAWDGGTTRVVVEGEEDLLGIPVLAEAPPGTVLVYGAPGRGVVVAHADAAMQDRVRRLVARMERL